MAREVAECVDMQLPCFEDAPFASRYRFGTAVIGPRKNVGVRVATQSDSRVLGIIQSPTTIRLMGVSWVFAGEALESGEQVTSGCDGCACRAAPGDEIFGMVVGGGSECRGDLVRVLLGFGGTMEAKNILRCVLSALRTAVTYRQVETAMTAAAVVLARDPKDISEVMRKWRVK